MKANGEVAITQETELPTHSAASVPAQTVVSDLRKELSLVTAIADPQQHDMVISDMATSAFVVSDAHDNEWKIMGKKGACPRQKQLFPRFLWIHVLVLPILLLVLISWAKLVIVRNWKKVIHYRYDSSRAKGRSGGPGRKLCVTPH